MAEWFKAPVLKTNTHKVVNCTDLLAFRATYPPSRDVVHHQRGMKISAIALLALANFFGPGLHRAMAALSPCDSWQTVSADKNFVLVMISWKPASEDGDVGSSARAIRMKYPQSGLYRNDGSTTPLWTMPYRCEHSEVYIAPDGQHLLFANDWNAGSDVVGMVTFFEQDRQLGRFTVTELTSCLNAKCLLGGFPRRTSSVFDPGAMRYSVSTNHGEWYVFDASTGRLIEHSSPFALYCVAAGVILAGGTAIGWWVLRGRRAS